MGIEVINNLRQKVGLTPTAPPAFVKAIMNPEDSTFDRLSCPSIGGRYNHLKNAGIKYFFAMDLHNGARVLPSLLGAVVQAINFLGERHCTLSIVEGRSTDRTYDIVAGVGEEITRLGATFYLDKNDTDPRGENVDRVESLAGLRNQALRPLVEQRTLYPEDTIVIFLNDIVLCVDDILELIHQHVVQSADHVLCHGLAQRWFLRCVLRCMGSPWHERGYFF